MSILPMRIDENIAKRIALSPVELSAGVTTGVEFDRLGASEYQFESVCLVVQAGIDTGAPSAFTVDCVLQESDTSGSAYTDVVAITQIDGEGEIETACYNLNSLKQYVRPEFTVAFTGGSSPTIYTSSAYLFGNSKTEPVA